MTLNPVARFFGSAHRKVSTVLLLGTIGFGLVPTAHAQLIFTIDSFTTNELIVTLSGTISGTNPTQDRNTLYLVEADDIESNWTLQARTAEAGAMTVGGYNLTNIGVGHYSPASADYMVWSTNSLTPFSVGDAPAGQVTQTVRYPGGIMNFVPSAATRFALYWGNPTNAGSGFQLQSIGLAQTGAVSAVPEPNTFAALLGVAALIVGMGQRRRHPGSR
ncbi:MAG: hypothetical protein SynsKO_42910 [Synoicihabitans sp.]